MKNNNRIIVPFLFILFFYCCSDDIDKNNISSYDNFSLVDINPNSDFYGQAIGLSYFNGQASSYYFGDQGWGLCQNRFGSLHILYSDLLNEGYANIKIIGINGINAVNDDLSGMLLNNSLPWLQDNNTEDVWNSWGVKIRDLIIFDRNGEYYTKINLTEMDLALEQNYNDIKNLLINALDQ